MKPFASCLLVIAASFAQEAEGLHEKLSTLNAQAAMLAEWASQGNDAYQRGTSSLDKRDWEKAVARFSEAIQKKSTRPDGALYWKAYALNKLGRRDEALASLAELEKTHSASRWLNDAKVLEAEVKQSSGQPVSPEQETNEEIKLYALNGLVHSEPERALPLLEKTLATSTSPKLKERALYVLAQIQTPPARELLSKIAFGNGNPDLQRKAVQLIGEIRSPDTSQKLSELYASSTDVELKRSILRAYAQSKDKDRLYALATSETDKSLRIDAIHMLSAAVGNDELWKLYASGNEESKRQIIRAAHGKGADDKLRELAKQDKEPTLRREAIRMIGHRESPDTIAFLLSLYSAEQDVTVRKAIVESLARDGNAKPLIELARKESDPELKKLLIRQLSRLKSKEATDYLMELLK